MHPLRWVRGRPEVTGTAEYNQRVIQAANRLRDAQGDYLKAIAEHVTQERLYKLGEAKAMLAVHDYKNADDRRAQVEARRVTIEDRPGEFTVNALRYAAHLAEGKRDAAKLAVQNYRTELSALQSLISLEKSEAEFAKWAPHEAVGT